MPIHDDAELLSSHAAPANAKAAAPAPDVARSADTGAASHQAVFELQRLAGNAVVSRLLAPGAQGGVAQREAAEDGEPGAQRSPVLDVVGKGGGRPLDVGIRREMEHSLGADFSGVRLHTDSTASESARAVNANAYTVGNDVVIRNDRYSPGTAEGRQTIAHELTHVVQQRSGPVAGRETGSGIRLSDPSDEFEQAAEQTAHAVVATGAAAPAPSTAAGAGAPSTMLEQDQQAAQGEFVQRQEGEELEEEEAAQGEFVQRQEGEELEEEEEVPAAQGEFVQRQGPDEEEEEAPAVGGA